MRTHHAYVLFPLAAVVAASACTFGTIIGTDGPGGSSSGTTTATGGNTSVPATGSTSSGTTTGPGSTSTSSTSTSSTTSSSTTTTDDGGTTTDGGGTTTGAPPGGCWDGTPVSQAGGPCGGNHYENPPTCAAGLVCNVSPSADYTGTCAAPGVQVGGFGGVCGGSSNTICPWDHMCQDPAAPGQPGTCIAAPCMNGYDGGPDDGCASPFLSLVGDGTPAEFDFACAGWPEVGPNPSSAVGYVGYPTADAGAQQLWIVGCRLPVLPENQTGITITAPLAGVGSTTAASLNAIGLNNPVTNNGSTSVQITYMDAVTIKGTYSATAQFTGGSGSTNISGSFRVCRAPDVQPQ